MQLLFLDTKPNNPNRYISRAVYKAVRRHPAVASAVWASYADALHLARKQAFDAFLAFDGEEAANAIVERLCAWIPRRAIWFTEDPYEFYRNVEVAKAFDIVFTNDATTAKRYPGRVRHLPLAADRDSHFLPMRKGTPRYDLFFAGTAWPNRLRFLRNLRRQRPNIRMKLVLVKNPALEPYIKEFDAEFEYSAGISIGDFCRLANASLLTLTLPRQFSTDPQNPLASSDTPGPRLFETALAGSCQLVERTTTPQALNLFDSQAQLLCYDTFDDCIMMIDRARSQAQQTHAIAAAAQSHALGHHLYDHRAEIIVSELSRLPLAPTSTPPALTRPRVLIVAHNIVRFGHFGGAELYLQKILQHASNVDCWVWVIDPSEQSFCHYNLYAPDGQLADQAVVSHPIVFGDLVHDELEMHFQRLMVQYAFDLVHINHFLWFPFSLPHIAKAYGVRTVVTLHDYFVICENYNLMGTEAKYCDILHRPPETCDICLERTRAAPPESQARRLRFLRESLAKVDRVLVGSKASADILLTFHPHLRNRVIEIAPPIHTGTAPVRTGLSGSRLNVALLGNFTRAKGAETFLRVLAATRQEPFAYHLFGRVDTEYEAELSNYPDELLRRHGSFSFGLVPKQVGDCDVALFLSPWPETYCVTLSEAQARGLVPIVTALGAQAERVRDGIDGLHVPIDDAERVAAALQRFLAEPGLLDKLRRQLPSPAGWSAADFAAAIGNLYDELLDAGKQFEKRSNLQRNITLEELGITLSSRSWLTPIAKPAAAKVAAPPTLPADRNLRASLHDLWLIIRGKVGRTFAGRALKVLLGRPRQ